MQPAVHLHAHRVRQQRHQRPLLDLPRKHRHPHLVIGREGRIGQQQRLDVRHRIAGVDKVHALVGRQRIKAQGIATLVGHPVIERPATRQIAQHVGGRAMAGLLQRGLDRQGVVRPELDRAPAQGFDPLHDAQGLRAKVFHGGRLSRQLRQAQAHGFECIWHGHTPPPRQSPGCATPLRPLRCRFCSRSRWHARTHTTAPPKTLCLRPTT